MNRAWLWRTALAAALTAIPFVALAQGTGSPDVPDLPGATGPTGATGVPGLEELAAGRAKPAARLGTGVVQAGAIDATRYILGPGDQMQLTLWGRVARSITLTVSPEGRVLLPGRPAVSVAGQTLAAIRERVMKTVAEQYLGVQADLQLIGLRVFKVYVSGQVKNPGAKEATSTMRASEVVLGAEPNKAASRRNIRVEHLDGTSSRVDLEAAERLGRQDADPVLVDGDVIRVPFGQMRAAVLGAVADPHEVELSEGDLIQTLIDLGGGLTPAATPDRAFMIRFRGAVERESLHVDLRDSTVLKQPIQDGDRLYIQYRPEYHYLPGVIIGGEVEHPGSFAIVAGRDRASDLIGWAGGFRSTANRAAVHLIRDVDVTTLQDPEFDRLVRMTRNEMTESEYTKLETKLAERKNSFTIDWSRLVPGSANDPLLQDRDIVRVDRFVPTVRIEGQVKRPGYVDYAPGRSLGEYIDLAGGFTDRSARTSVRVSRSLTGQIIPAQSLHGVQPGDFIWVPERRDFDAWASFRDVITVVSQVAVIIYTLSRP